MFRTYNCRLSLSKIINTITFLLERSMIKQKPIKKHSYPTNDEVIMKLNPVMQV